MDDKIIKNTSYTNKDFQTIYPELLDLVKRLTNKWDPSLSNESDPGVLLLKLNALIADKNNYNIDKNILECFPTSVTQEGNARRLYDSLGYKMHWYRSATTTVGFQFKSTKYIETTQYKIPQFTMLSDSNSKIVYTTLKDVRMSTLESQKNNIYNVEAIEGIIKNFELDGGKTELTLDNLDSNLRLYFNEQNVAENGIFIKRTKDISWTAWKAVDNIASYPLNSLVYEFGVLPNSNVCYIEFPQDIASMLDTSNTFQIKYVLSTGTQGNIKKNNINSFLEEQKVEYTTDNNETAQKVINDQIHIIQTSGTINGEDPETVEDAYRNYKKTVGTFNTLVTRRDYENYLYNAKVGSDNLVSNCVVSDRTNDLNATLKVQTWTPTSNTEHMLVLNSDDGKGPLLNAYDIVLYSLNSGDGTYDSTFEPNTDGYIKSMLESMVDEVKAIEHNFSAPNDFTGLIDTFYYLYKNLYTLKGQIVTYDKVSQLEAEEIETKVLNALEQNYNARNINFGEEPNYSELINVITEADSRIKTVALNIPKYQTYHVAEPKESDNGIPNFATPTNLEKLRLVAKMILSGNVQLFKFDKGFNFDFGVKNIINLNETREEDKNIADKNKAYLKSITTEANIEITKDEIQLKKNENIQLYAPSYIVDTEYSTFVKYRLCRLAGVEERIIEAEKDYVLRVGESLKLVYTDSNNIIQAVSYGEGTIINSSVALTSSSVEDLEINADDKNDTENFKILKTGQTIKIKKVNSHIIPTQTKLYFILNKDVNRLQLKNPNGDSQENNELPEKIILQEGEVLIYTNADTNELMELGSGTQLSLDPETAKDKLDIIIDDEALTEINEDTLSKVTWRQNSQPILVTELEIITLGEGVKIKFSDSTTDAKLTLTNEAQILPQEITIIDNTGSILKVSNYVDKKTEGGLAPYSIFSRLSINTTLAEGQKLTKNQKITLNYVNSKGDYITPGEVITEGQTLIFNTPIILGGGNNLDAALLTDKKLRDYSLIAYSYTIDDNYNLVRDKGILKVSGKESSILLPFTFSKNSEDKACWLIPIYVSKTSPEFNVLFKVKYKDGSNNDQELTLGTYQDPTLTLFKDSGSYILVIPADKEYKDLSVSIRNGTEADIITIGKISRVLGLNKEEIDVVPGDDNNYSKADSFEISKAIEDLSGGQSSSRTIFTEIDTLIKASSDPNIQFDYTYVVPEAEKVLHPTDSNSYWNVNHIANRYTIAQINIDKTKENIKVNTYSINS